MHAYKSTLSLMEKLATYTAMTLIGCTEMPNQPSTVKDENIKPISVGLPITFRDTLIKTNNGVDLVFYPIQEKADSFYFSIIWGNGITPEKYTMKNSNEIRVSHQGCVPIAQGSVKRFSEENNSSFISSLDDLCE